MSKEKKIVVGQTIWLPTLSPDKLVEPFEVTKVGNKYFYICKDFRERKFNISDMREEVSYCAPITAYLSEQEYFDHREKCGILSRLRTIFSTHSADHFTVEQLRQIKKILER